MVLDRDLLLLIGILHEIIIRHGVVAETYHIRTRVGNNVKCLCNPGSFDELA